MTLICVMLGYVLRVDACPVIDLLIIVIMSLTVSYGITYIV